MIFWNRPKFTAIVVIALVALLAACEKDLTTIGAGVIGSEPFDTNVAIFDVFSNTKKIRAVRTNRLPVYQLGTFIDPVYGKTEAKITTQVQLSAVDPNFGDKSAGKEETPENETVESVYLYIPFLTNSPGDADLDGVIDSLDKDPANPNSDTDGDNLTDNQEKSKGTDPLNRDTDGDGINDDVDNEFVRDQFARNFELDSIYGKRDKPFNLKVQRFTYFLRDLDPNTNFQEAQEYYSDQDFSAFATELISLDTTRITISPKEILLPKKEDPTTEIIESDQVVRLGPGIRVQLDKDFFQRNILDKEGSSELLTQANFSNFLRGIHFTLEPTEGEELLMLFDMRAANITISYSYTAGIETKNKDFVLNFLTQQKPTRTQTFPIVGNAVNTFKNEAYPPVILDEIVSKENAERIYLKGGAGSFAEIRLFDTIRGREAIKTIKANNWIINEAHLVFYVDATTDAIKPPRLYLYNLETNVPLIGRNDVPAQANTLQSYPFYGGLLEGDGSAGSEFRYTVKITDYINDLIARDGENAVLGLTITPDITIFNTSGAMLDDDTESDLPVAATLSPLGTVLFSGNADAANSAKKLQLEIFYTEAN